MNIWDELTFNKIQSVFYNWMSHLASVIQNAGEYIIEDIPNDFTAFSESQNRRRSGSFCTSCICEPRSGAVNLTTRKTRGATGAGPLAWKEEWKLIERK
jgi:hypothetical protein